MPFPPRKIPSLVVPRARVARARKHIAELQAELTPGARPDLFRGSVVPDAEEGGAYAISVHLSPCLDVRWGLMASDALHHLRSALDEAFCQLVRLKNPKDKCHRCSFPVDHKADGQKLQKALRTIPPAAAAIIEELQPYKPGNGGRRALLQVLHDLNNWDKHRSLAILTRNMAFPYDGITANGEREIGSAVLTTEGYTQYAIQEADGWTTYRGIFRPLPGTVVHETGEPSLYLGWGWHWEGNPGSVDRSLVLIADEVDSVLNRLEPIFVAEAERRRAEWDALGNPEVTLNEWLEGLEQPG